MWPQQCWIVRKDHLPQPASNTLLMKLRMLLTFAMRVHWWVMVHLLSTRLSRSASTGPLSSQSVPTVYWCLRLFIPKGRTVHSSLLKFMQILGPISPACQGCSEWQHNHLMYQPLLPVLYHLQTCSLHLFLQLLKQAVQIPMWAVPAWLWTQAQTPARTQRCTHQLSGSWALQWHPCTKPQSPPCHGRAFTAS